MKKLSNFVLATAFGLAYASTVLADDTHHHAASEHAAHAAAPMGEGEVKKVDKEAGKLIIKHGPLENLNMPGMTMAFRVQDPAMLDQVKAGDKIKFVADRINGSYTVTKLEASK